MIFFLVTCYTQNEKDPPIFGVYSTQEIAYEHANKIINNLGYDDTKWSNNSRVLSINHVYKGFAYISEIKIDQDFN